MKKLFCVLIALFMTVIVVLPCVSLAEAAVTASPEQPISPTDVSWLSAYLDYVIVGICVVIGLLIKHCTPLDNRYIPLIVALVGLAISVWSHWTDGITPTVILGGLFSGLASTGFHQVFKQLFDE